MHSNFLGSGARISRVLPWRSHIPSHLSASALPEYLLFSFSQRLELGQKHFRLVNSSVFQLTDHGGISYLPRSQLRLTCHLCPFFYVHDIHTGGILMCNSTKSGK